MTCAHPFALKCSLCLLSFDVSLPPAGPYDDPIASSASSSSQSLTSWYASDKTLTKLCVSFVSLVNKAYK